jgi:Na+/H+ antiporter
MAQISTVVVLLFCAIPLIALARRSTIPYPIILTIGGLALGFIPGLQLDLNPDLVLLIVLPPLLYWESVTAPTDAMRVNARWIWTLAIGLVLATTAAVAAVVHALEPSISWAAAFVLGAIVAPTDEIASAPIAERLGVPRHVIAVIEGESLLNDAGSLVLYAVAVAAVTTGQFALGTATLEFFGAAIGAAVIGAVAAGISIVLWRRFADAQIQVIISVLLPFLAYIPAQYLHVSGVLAVVVAGVIANRVTPVVITPAARIQAVAWWESTVFLMNVALFIVLGMQLNGVVAHAVQRHGWGELLRDTLVVNVVVIGVRFAWIFAQGALPFFGRMKPHGMSERKDLTVMAMGGLRGSVSLAAALAIPFATNARAPFPDRDLIIFITFTVILVTLVGGGLLMPFVVRALAFHEADEDRDELRLAVRTMVDAGLASIERLRVGGKISAAQAASLKEQYQRKRERFDLGAQPELRAAAQHQNQVESIIVAEERGALLALRKSGSIDNTVMRRLQLTLDLHQTLIDRSDDDGAALLDSTSELTVSQ